MMYRDPGETPNGPPSSDREPPQDLVTTLTDPHAKHALQFLRGEDGPVDLDRLARGVVGRMEGEPTGEVTDDVARRVATWLHHGHLPVMEAHGVVDYDAEEGRVRLVDSAAVPRLIDAAIPDPASAK